MAGIMSAALLQRVAVCCSVLQCVALDHLDQAELHTTSHCCKSVAHIVCVALLQYFAACCRDFQRVAACSSCSVNLCIAAAVVGVTCVQVTQLVTRQLIGTN